MWLRFAWASFVGWILSMVLVVLVLRFVLPDSLHGVALAILPWCISFVIAFIVAEKAFAPSLPGAHQTSILSILWIVIGFTLFLVYGEFFLGDVRFIVNSSETYVSLLVQVLGVCLASYVTRRRKIKETLGEGLAE